MRGRLGCVGALGLLAACADPPESQHAGADVDAAGASDAVPPDDAGPPDATWRAVSAVVVGGGRVVSDPPGLDCTAACAAFFHPDQTVSLTPAASPGQLFGGFSGDCSGASCSLAPGGDRVVQAAFHGDPAAFWKRQYSSAWTDSMAVAVDGGGNVVVVGQFDGTLDPGTGPIVSDGRDVLVARYSSGGEPLWSRAFPHSMVAGGRSVGVLPSGDVIVAGSYVGPIDLGDGVVRSSNGEVDLFVARLSAQDGSVMWIYCQGGPSYDLPRALALDASGDVRVAGDFRVSIDFGQGSVPGAYYGTGFVLSIDGATGTLDWAATRSDAPGSTMVVSVAVDDMGNAYALEWPIDPGASTGRPSRLYVVDDTGAQTRDQPLGVLVSPTDLVITGNSLYLTGNFAGGLDWNGHAVMATGGTSDVLLARLTLDGDAEWLRGIGGAAGYDVATSLALTPDGTVTIAGMYQGVVEFGDDPSGDRLATGGLDVFLATYDQDGGFVAAAVVGGLGADHGLGLAVGSSGIGALVGKFTDGMNLLGDQLVATGGEDMFVVATSYLPMDGNL